MLLRHVAGLIFGTVLVASLHGAQGAWKFSFAEGAGAGGAQAVDASALYSAERGFGFEPGAAPIVSGGKFVSGDKPFLFSAAVPEGNYRVRVSLGDPQGESNTTVKAESRRLVLERVVTRRGEVVKREFIVNVRNKSLPPPPPNAPGGTEVRLNDREEGHYNWDDKLTLEFVGPAPKLAAVEIEPASVPTIFLAGDSTVTDQRWEPGASWGQMLPRFFKPVVAVANHAESGETLKSFFAELRLDKILLQIKPGDYLFIQFGHNDEKSQWPQTYAEASTTYRSYLRAYIAEARRRGATPVLITSMHRRNFDARGKIVNTHGDYPEAVRAVANEEHVALIDLHQMSAAFYEALGPDKSTLAFSNGGKDPTHHNNYGAYELARCVVEGIKAAKLPMSEWLVEEVAPFDPAKPDPVEIFSLPASAARSDLRPRGN
jgi:lysophospholipase L1-like esterase